MRPSEDPKKKLDWGTIGEKVVFYVSLLLVITALGTGIVYAASNNLVSHHSGTTVGDYLQQSLNGIDGWTKDTISLSTWSIPVGGSQTQSIWIKSISASSKTLNTPLISWVAPQPAGITVSAKSGGLDLSGQTIASSATKQIDVIVSADGSTLEGAIVNFDIAVSAS